MLVNEAKTVDPARAAAPPSTSATNARLSRLGDYELLDEIARGGMGVVYRARHTKLNRIVALKMILSGQLAGNADVRRFQAEAEAVAQLDHSGIVPIFEVGEIDGHHFFSMGLVERGSLADRLRDGPLSPRVAANHAMKVALAIDYAHQQNVVHRDLKPANVLLDINDIPKVTDFGLAKRIEGDSDLTRTGQVLGTPSFMSPEQASGKQVGAPSDVYSLGAILYACCTGRPPFQAATAVETIMQVVEQDPVEPRQLNPQVPRDLETITLKCLEKEPHRRYESAARLAEDLSRYLADEPIRARPLGIAERSWRWLRKQGRSVALSAASIASAFVLTLLAAAVWYAYSQWRLGNVSITTERPPVVAQFHHLNNQAATDPVTLPTAQAMALPARDYRVQVRADGRLTRQHYATVERGESIDLDVDMDDQLLWPSMEFDGDFRTVRWDGRTDVLQFDDHGVTRIHGGTGKTLWTHEIASPKNQVVSEVTWPWYFRNHRERSLNSFDQRPFVLTSPSFDIDGDGQADLVLSARHEAWCLALSGVDGKQLWLSRRAPSQSKHPASPVRPLRQIHSATLSPPQLIGDIDGDRVPDYLCTLGRLRSDSGKQPLPGKPQSEALLATNVDRWLEIISGKTGKTHWRFELRDEWFELPKGADVPVAFRWHHESGTQNRHSAHLLRRGRQVRRTTRPYIERGGLYSFAPATLVVPPAATDTESGSKIVVLAGNHILDVSLTSNAMAEPRVTSLPPTHEVNVTGASTMLLTCRPPQLADVDGDGHHELVLFQQPVRRAGSNAPDINGRLIVWSLRTGEVLWNQTVAAQQPRSEVWASSPPSWPLIEDVDGDTSDEIIVPHNAFLADDPLSTRLGQFDRTEALHQGNTVRLMDGRTGEPRWQQRMSNIDPQVDRFTIGPDVNGDGIGDLFVATMMFDDAELFVDCLSGKDGSRIWWNRQRLGPDERSGFGFPYCFGSLRWWSHGDRHPKLVIHTLSAQDNESEDSTLFLVEPDSGRWAGMVPNVKTYQTADMDGDGHQELLAVQFNRTPFGGKLHVLRGAATALWSRLCTDTTLYAQRDWRPAADLDADGSPDLINERMAVSGMTGRRLWASERPLFRYRTTQLDGDLDGDAIPDLLTTPKSVGTDQLVSVGYVTSGRTGRLLWSSVVKTSGNFGTPLRCSRDVDHDGHPEVVLTLVAPEEHRTPGASSPPTCLQLLVLDGRTGRLRWRTRLSGKHDEEFRLSWGLDSSESTWRWSFANLNGDNDDDILVTAERHDTTAGYELRALEGHTGKVLWTHPLQRSEGSQAEFELTSTLPVDPKLDESPDIAVLQFFRNDTAPDGGVCISLLDGRTGTPQWSWRRATELPPTGPHERTLMARRSQPFLVHGGNHQTLIGVHFWGRPGEIVLFDLSGTVVSRFDVAPTGGDFQAVPFDVDADGVDEVVLLHGGKLRVVGLTGTPKTLWELSSEFSSADLVETILPAVDAHNATLVCSQHLQDRIIGVDATSGQILWSCHEPNSRPTPMVVPSRMRGHPAATQLSPARTIPVLFRYDKLAVVRQPQVVPSQLQLDREPEIDPREYRPLPWMVPMRLEERTAWDEGRVFLWWCFLSVALVVWPLVYAMKTVRHRTWSLLHLLLLPVLVGLAILAASVPHPLRESAANSLIYRLINACLMIPVVVCPFWLIKWTLQGRWRHVVTWLGVSCVVSVALVPLFMYLDNQNSFDSTLRYSWQGWYRVWIYGGYLTGWCFFPASAYGSLSRWRKKS